MIEECNQHNQPSVANEHVSAHISNPSTDANSDGFNEGEDNHNDDDVQQEDSKKFAFLYLFASKKMALRTVNMFYQWFAVTLVYYGLSFSAVDLAGDPHLNFCAIVAVEVPGSTNVNHYLMFPIEP